MEHHVLAPLLIALGANLPVGNVSPTETLQAALGALEEAGLRVLRASPFYETPCFPAGAGPDYVNAAARLACPAGMGAADILSRLHRVEDRFGRARKQRWGMRTLDLDLLALGATVLPDAETHARWRDLPPDSQARVAPGELVLPHPRLQDRAFVLVPLADVAPRWRHPVLGLTVAALRNRLPAAERAAVRRLAV